MNFTEEQLLKLSLTEIGDIIKYEVVDESGLRAVYKIKTFTNTDANWCMRCCLNKYNCMIELDSNINDFLTFACNAYKERGSVIFKLV